jgi:hypothetical protein
VTRPRTRSLSRPPLAALLLLALAGCGHAPPDLFEVRRAGRDAGANVHLVVSDGGSVSCNGREDVALDAERLLAARQLARDLAEPAALGLELPAGPGATLRYRARLELGSIAFSDRSPQRPPAFDRLVAFTADVAENVCGIER